METTELYSKIKQLIEDVASTHKYSMSRIYGLYNEAFGVVETPQSCASCLIRKVNQLKRWLAEQEAPVQASTEIKKQAGCKRKKS